MANPEQIECMWEPDEDMKLPEGKTCNDCHWFKRCVALIGQERIVFSTVCDWAPSRFREKLTEDFIGANI